MTSLKQNLKQILINKQHKQYEKEVSSKKMSYSDWIEKQEEKIQIGNIIISETANCLTNEKFKQANGGDNKKNEGFHSENAILGRVWKITDPSEENNTPWTFLSVTVDELAEMKDKEKMEFLQNCEADVILFLSSEGEFSKIALPLIYQKFKNNKNIILIYGDEDVKNEGRRRSPWLKPDWSPDTFLSNFYFGSLTAVRTNALKEMEVPAEKEPFLYGLSRNMIEKYHGFSMRKEENTPVFHIPEILFHSKEEGYEAVREWSLSPKQEQSAEKTVKTEESRKVKENQRIKESQETKESQGMKQELPLISVIIPSKDNPKVLFTCIHSFLTRTETAYPYEIIIVDNGSKEENRKTIEEEVGRLNRKAKKEQSFREITYYYQAMPFNFSHMCNLGAEKAAGSLLLFLNDDMEIIQENWLTLLAEKAVLPYAGAVGAKPLYPDSAVIQHAGITNLRVGPAHKLQFLSDEQNHYYGRNRGVHDMMAVTGACLMLRRVVFEAVGGFAEELAVAFNDVDLCYTIYEKGFYNIVRNDVVLYHHESLSRGKDGESEEKQKRLLREKDVLYARHQEIYGKDPFYHKYLTTDMLESEYSPAFRYQVTLDMPWSKVEIKPLAEEVREDSCVVIGMECAMDIYKWKYGVEAGMGKTEPSPSDMGYYFQGYSFVIGADNACYEKTLLLQNKETLEVLRVPADARYRQDIRNNLKDQLNVDLTGFAAKVQMDSIPDGVYRFGMLARDKCSRQKLVNWSNWVLEKGK